MFQIDWAQVRPWTDEQRLAPPSTHSAVKRNAVERTALLHWEEHCHECAIPICYTTCSLYVPRADRKCARFAYGIFPAPGFSGLFDFGADIRFRRWAKLETQLYGKSVSVRQHRVLDRINRAAVAPRPARSDLASRLGVSAKTLFAKARNKYFVKVGPAGSRVAFDEFVLECYSPEKNSFQIVLEYFNHEVKARHSFRITPGWNLYTLPASTLQSGTEPPRGKLTLSLENDAEKRLVFTWLDLVKYADSWRPTFRENKTQAAAAKVKCVAWDLDNTLWTGILAEGIGTNLAARPEALELIKKLDERGIIQTVVSKNTFADAWPVIERLGLQDYFLYPAINWQPKSSNLKGIAQKLNVNIDTFALIDDSAFERAEVHTALPQVRVYSEDQIGGLLERCEFDVPISESSRIRRASYLTEIRREKERETFDGDYEAFLRSCKMKMRLFVPREERHILRCHELIQRSNQLNLSNTRYSPAEFRFLLSAPGTLCVAMDCEDRFGAYGIVGFASVDETAERPTLHDLVISCRVAQKRVEHAFVEWLAVRERARGTGALLAAVVRTDRNAPIRQVFTDLRFRPLIEKDVTSVMELSLDRSISLGDIVRIEVDPELTVDGCDHSAAAVPSIG